MNQTSNRPVDWEALVLRQETRLYRTALAILGNRQEAEDVVQDVFVKYLQARPAFHAPEQEAAWFARVTVNHCISHLRSAWRRRVVPLVDELPAVEPADRQALEELYQLPPKDRAVIHLYYYEGYSTADLAAMLGQSQGTIRSRLARARGKLKKLLEGEA